MRATATVLARVEDQRLAKAAERIRNGTYRTTITLQTEEEVRGLVKKDDDREYGCTLTPAGAYCSCPDALYRGSICKHAVTLALWVIRDSLSRPTVPGSETKLEEQRSYILSSASSLLNFRS